MFVDYQYKIANIVASTSVGSKIDLFKLYDYCDNAEFDPEFYHALKYRTQNPKQQFL